MKQVICQSVKKYSGEALKKTALYDFHVRNGGKMVPFAGYGMAVLYGKVGIKESHMWCREHCGMFDVGHMGQLHIFGEDREDFLESLVPGNIKDLKVGSARLTQFTNENGGIMDDTIITRKEGHIYQVVNAACVDQDLAHMHAALESFDGDVTIEFIEDRALIALQGPSTVDVVQPLVDYDLSEQAFMTSVTATLGGVEDCFMARLGYTGEDGWEISIPNESAEFLAEKFLSHPEVELAGLAPRDTLRLEAGLCLMGSDMNPGLTPIESNLRWTIGKRRREEMNFPGAEKIVQQWHEGTDVMRVGFTMDGKRVAREHYPVYDESGKKELGEVTSGTLAPCIDIPIGMCYVPIEYADIGTKIMVDVRGKLLPATIAPMPFVEQNYYRKP